MPDVTPPAEDVATQATAPAPPERRRVSARRVARNAMLLSAATVAARLSSFALGIALARGLGLSDYGLYGFALALSLVLQPLADLGMTQYAVREAARDHLRLEIELSDLFRVKLLATASVLGAASVVAVLVAHNATVAAIVLLMLAAALGDGVSQLVFGYFQGRERMGFEARLTTAVALARALGGIAAAFAVGSVIAVGAWILAVSVVQLTYATARLRRLIVGEARSPRRGRRRPDWRTVLTMGLMVGLTLGYTRADAVLIGFRLGEEDVGLYAAAYTIMLGLQIVPWMMTTALGPVFTSTHARERDAFGRAWQEGIRSVLLVALPLSLTVCLLAGPVIHRAYGAEFAPAADSLAVLAWASPLAALASLASVALRGAGRERWLVTVSAAAVVVNVGGNLVLIPTVGIIGAAAMTVVTEVLVTAGLVALGVRHGVLPLPRPPLVRLALAAGALAAVALALRNAPVELAAGGALAAFAVAAGVTRLVGASDVAALRQAARRLG